LTADTSFLDSLKSIYIEEAAMANVLVMTDSVACIPPDIVKEFQIKVVPAANITVNGKTYIEGETISADEAYGLIKKDPDSFVTSPISPDYLLRTYRELAEKSNQILFITIASSLTAVNKTAKLAADLFIEQSPGTTIRVLDSRACASTQGLVVMAAARAASQGKSMDEIAALAERTREKAGGIMMLDTLRYVYRTGRMSKVASRIVSVFNIKPINKITETGELEMIDRSRKTSDGIERLIKAVAKDGGQQPLHFMVTHAAAAENARYLAEQIKQRFQCLSMVIGDYSPVMGYGAGPGALFVGFHPEIN
jgi:fatty acid kinase fatty acid binding subunit